VKETLAALQQRRLFSPEMPPQVLYHGANGYGDAIIGRRYIKTYVDGEAKPSFEYVDGHLLPKGIGTRKHLRIQRRLLELLSSCQGFEAFPELHTRLREREFRIPDIVVERKPVGDQEYPVEPVYLCIEILSPDQTLPQLIEKCKHYHAWGTDYCWIIDPEKPSAWEYRRGGQPRLLADDDLLAAGEIHLVVRDVFAVLAE
jgi:Uma2 family endonuclease